MPQLFVPCPSDVSEFLNLDLDRLAASASSFGISLTHENEGADVALLTGDTRADTPAIRLVASPIPGEISITEEIDGKDQRLSRLVAEFGSALDDITCHAAFASCPEPMRSAGGATGPGSAPSTRDLARRHRAVQVLFNSVPAEPDALALLIADGVHALGRKPPRISIVINNYNYDQYLGHAIESAINQTRPANDIVVVDDGSQDGSRETLKSYREIRTICKANGGQASAFNSGFAAAEGDLIVFLDADDMLAPDAVERLSQEDPITFARLSFSLETMDSGGAPTGLFPMSRVAASGELKGSLLSQGTLLFMPTSGNAFPRSTLERLLPMPEAHWRISADVYLAYGATLLGPAKHLDVPLGRYRLHGANNYYHPFGSDAPFSHRKISQRLAAFRDLAKLAEQDRTIATASEVARLRELAAPGSARARIGSWHSDRLEPKRALSMPPLAAGQSGRPPRGRLEKHLRTKNPALFAAPATWPLVRPGARLDLSAYLNDSPLGSGWREKPGIGSILSGAYAVVALRFPGPRADWVLRIKHKPLDGATLDLWINGMRHQALTLDDTGWVEIRVAGLVLELDRRSLTWRAGITLVPRSAAQVIVERIEVTRVCASQFGAPVLRNRTLVKPDSAVGQRMLSKGWDWPDEHGAAMVKSEAFLRFTIAERCDARLVLFFSRPPSLISIGGSAVSTQPDASGRGVQVRIDPAQIPFSGIVDLGIVAFDVANKPRLEAVQLLTGPIEPGALSPGGLIPTSDLECRTLADDTLSVSWANPVSGRLVLHFDADQDVPHERVGIWLRDQMVEVDLAGTGSVVFNAPDPLSGVRLRLPNSVRLTAIGHLEAQERVSAVPRETSDLSLRALARSADEGSWRLADEEALWLTTNRARLTLPAGPAGRSHIRMSAIALEQLGQVLRVRHGNHCVETGGLPGQQVLDVPIGTAAEDGLLVMDIETNLLVDAARVGLDDGFFLGGAILGVDFVSLAEHDNTLTNAMEHEEDH